jgi:tetratricopeptide (TPR) repeat protein
MDYTNKEKIQNNVEINKAEAEMNEINKLIESLDFESAKHLLQKRLSAEPKNVDVIDLMSEVLMNLDETEQAITLIKKSISLEPNKNAEKYMTIGQLSDYKLALKYYEKGISIFINELNNETDNQKLINIKNSLASAYSAVAELYMNSDLW